MSIISESEGVATMTINHYERILRERDEARDALRDMLSGWKRPTPETDDQPIIYAINDNGYQVPCVDIEYARKLERERDEAREECKFLWDERDQARGELSLKQQTLTIAEGTLSDLRKQRDEWAAMCGRYKQERDIAEQDATNYHARIIELIDERDKTKRERDEAREKVKELIYIADRAIELAEIDFENDKFGVVSELRDGLQKIKKETK